MDRITKAYVETFRKEQSLENVSDTEAFELFATYCVVSDAYDDEFNVTEPHTGGGDDLGVDGIAIIVNGALVTTPDEVIDLYQMNNSLDVTFIFVQAKSAAKFDGAEIGSFMDGVEAFFDDEGAPVMNDRVANYRTIMQEIYTRSIGFRRSKPSCRLSYVTTGQWNSPHQLVTRIEKGKQRLRATNLFADVHFAPMGADELHASYQRSKNRIITEFTFADRVLLPNMEGVSQAWLGFIPAPEFLRLTTDDLGNIRKSLFTDNVRDFQGDRNAVNNDIRRTLQNPANRERFVILNNGITIVARDLQLTRDNVTVTDYQIVNGCQTSHVLFEERGSLDTYVKIPVKIISTQDEDVINAIITATNRQTQVTTEDLLARGPFAKKIEEHLKSYDSGKRLYYERRSKQYNTDPSVEKVRVITKAQLVRAFAALFLDEPHRASSYYSELYTQVGDTIFNPSHMLEPYYTAAYAHYRLEFLFRNNGIDVAYKPVRYHILMVLRHIYGGTDIPSLSSRRAIQAYCSPICEILWSRPRAINAFQTAATIIDNAVGGPEAELSREQAKRGTFTRQIKRAVQANVS